MSREHRVIPAVSIVLSGVAWVATVRQMGRMGFGWVTGNMAASLSLYYRGEQAMPPTSPPSCIALVGWNILSIVKALILGEVAIRLTDRKSAMDTQKSNSDGNLAWRTLSGLLHTALAGQR